MEGESGTHISILVIANDWAMGWFGESRATTQNKKKQRKKAAVHFSCSLVFRLDALALSVIATATWLAGWLAGWLSHSGIVSKRLNLSENVFDNLKAPSL